MAQSLSGGGTVYEDDDDTDGEDNTVLEGNLDLEAMGLTKDDLRRLVLASYVTQSTVDTELGIEITEEELQEILDVVELNQLYTEKQTTPDEAGYYYVLFEDEDTGERKFFTATRGSIRIENENGDQMICVNNATFDYYLDWFNGNANKEVAANTTKKMYTVKEIGKIEMITYTRTNQTYQFSTETEDYAEDTEIQQCMVPLELLVDFLQISASPDFLEAFEKLVINQDITLQVFSLSTEETTETQRTYPIDITVDARKTMTFQARRSSSGQAGGNGVVDTVTEYEDLIYDLSPFNLQANESTETEAVTFDVKLVSADSWYFKADRTVTKNTITTYEYYNENGEATTFTPGGSDALADAPEYTIPGFTISGFTSMEELAAELRERTGSDWFDLDAQINEINSKLEDRSDVQDIIDYYTDNNGYAADSGSGFRDYQLIEYNPEITNITATAQNGTEKKVKRTARDMLTVGTMDYEDNTDAFLGLWKNASGHYEEGALFDPDGEVVQYKDVYEDRVETAPVGNLFENADLMLFELLDYSENTQSITPVMKYILYRYTGNDYGVTSFDQLMTLMGFNPTSVSNFVGDTVQEKVWWALLDAGYSKIAAAAVLGNIECESGFNPSAIEGGTGIGLGLCQWSYGRRTQLEGYIASKGTTTSDVGTQIEFLLGELTPGGGANGYASYQLGGVSSSAYDGTNYTASDWQDATDLGRATTAFMALFERPSYDPSINHISRRIQAAQDYYNRFKDMERPQPGTITGVTGDGYSQTYTSSTGKTYKEYKQWTGSYANMVFSYYSPETIAQSGCSITSVAVVTSGYSDNQTPGSLASREPYLAQLLTEGGANCSGYEAADAARLTSGKPAVVSISGTLVTERGSKYYGGHYIAILDGRNGNEVYVSDVGANDAYCGGWTNVQNIIDIVNQGVLYVNN